MDDLQLMEFGSGDVGLPGDKYRIRLRIAGRYRALHREISGLSASGWCPHGELQEVERNRMEKTMELYLIYLDTDDILILDNTYLIPF